MTRLRRALLAMPIRAFVVLMLLAAPYVDRIPVRAQDSTCIVETEPNNTEGEVQPVESSFCIDGSLPEVGDQDLFVWTVTEDDAKFWWSLSVNGPYQTSTTARILAISSEPDIVPLVAGSEIKAVTSEPTATGPVSSTFLIGPGRYLVGISRTDRVDFTPPPDTDYALSLHRSGRLPKRLDKEPNDDAISASQVSGAFQTAGDLSGSSDFYAWTIADEEARSGWELEFHAAIDFPVSLTLSTAETGEILASYSSQTDLVLYDLSFKAGTYVISVSGQSESAKPYSLASRTAPIPENDLEPNNAPIGASVIDPENPVVKGRLAAPDDVDMYRLTVDDEMAGSLFDIRLVSRQKVDRTFCLSSVETGYDLQCKQGPGGATMSTILLPKGIYMVRVSGQADPDAPYILRIDITTPPSSAFETEPNDTEQIPAELNPDVPIQGRYDGEEWDAFHFTTSGEPQLWDVSITGTGIRELKFTQRDGTEMAAATVAVDGTSAMLYDLYLTPGDHWLRTYGSGGTYSITLTANGPPPEDGEHEANNSEVTSEPLMLSQTKSGRLADVRDVDFYRFSLAAVEHVSIKLVLPDTATHRMTIYQSTDNYYQGIPDEPGDMLKADLFLDPGDYIIRIDTTQGDLGRYELKTGREDPFVTADDQEPNDTAETAQPIAPGQTIAGDLLSGDPADMFAITDDSDSKIRFTLDSDGVYPAISDGEITYSVEQSADDGTWTNSQRLPQGIQLYILLSGVGTYTLTYGEEKPAGSILDPGNLTGGGGPDLDLALTFDQPEIAAYWEQQQTVAGSLVITNNDDDTVSGTLQTTTSQYAWVASLQQDAIELASGETATIPVTVVIDPDAWANVPVRITVGLFGVDSKPLTAFFEITPTASAAPVSAETTWPVPDSMLGGLNLASPALGAVPAGTIDLIQEALLYDGLAPIGASFWVSGPILPLEVSVDLAGDNPAPIAGFILNSRSGDGLRSSQVRHFEIQLSTDGSTYETVVAGELSLLVQDQYFPLETPAQAVAARLRIIDSYNKTYPNQPNYISLGEFSVIAAPGYIPESLNEINLADPALGGHIVRMSPQQPDPNSFVGMLDSDLATHWYFDDPDNANSFTWTIGFGNNRAAQVSKIGWKERDGWNPETEAIVDSVKIEVAVDSLNGPWTEVSTWNLKRNENGDARSFTPDTPVWARYIRFTTSLDTTNGNDGFMPGQITVTEAPTTDDYRSATGAYGSTNRSGPYEVANPIDYDELTDPNDAPDDQSSAAELEFNTTINGLAQIGKDVDWYKVTVPEGDNTLSFDLVGSPQVDVVVRIYDQDGNEVQATRSINGTTASLTYTATAEPGETYTVRVEQPPHSIMFTFDTSISVYSYLPLVLQSVRAFAGGVTKGQEYVNLLPFTEEPLIETWSDDSYLVYSAITGYVNLSSSSSAEQAILDSSGLLSSQEGTTAILIETDAETSSFGASEEMWNAMNVLQPRVFAVHIGGSTTPMIDKNLMQDWASYGGYYQYANSQAEIDRAFDRAATWLRRPTAYSLTVESSFVEPATPTPAPTAEPLQPGSLAVAAPESSGYPDAPAAQISDQVTVEIIFDTSGSMLGGLPDGTRRIDVARSVLSDLVLNQLPPGMPVTLRVFGNQPDSCDTSQLVPLGPLDPVAMSQTIQAIEPVNLVRTPIGEALLQVGNDLAGVSGPKVVILVTDGEETCDGDPAAAIRELRAQGFDIQVNIVGFALDDDALRQQFRDWAALGGGIYADATNAEELSLAIASAAQAPFRVTDGTGRVVATGTVGGEAVDLPPGTYTVTVLTNPEQTFEQVIVEEGQPTVVQLPDTGG